MLYEKISLVLVQKKATKRFLSWRFLLILGIKIMFGTHTIICGHSKYVRPYPSNRQTEDVFFHQPKFALFSSDFPVKIMTFFSQVMLKKYSHRFHSIR